MPVGVCRFWMLGYLDNKEYRVEPRFDIYTIDKRVHWTLVRPARDPLEIERPFPSAS